MSRYVIAWTPIVALPIAAWIGTADVLDAWAFMWLFAFAIYAGSKWLTWWLAPAGAPWQRQAGYLLAWPGLDAPTFLFSNRSQTPAWRDWLFALAKLGFGATLLAMVVPRLPTEQVLIRGWVGMVSIVFVLHFGIFDLLSLLWRTLGVNAKPLMDWPIRAESVSEFWGQRWNTAFRDLTHRFLFRPLTARVGARAALAIGFLFSGIVHDLVISLPARGGYGGPTIFFLVQAAAIFFERSALGKRIGLGRGVIGWAFTMVVLIGPVWLLFHPPFVRDVVVPFLDWIVWPASRAP